MAEPPRTLRDIRGDSDRMDLAKTGDIARSPYGYAGAVDGPCLLSSDKAGLQKVTTFMSFLHEKNMLKLETRPGRARAALITNNMN